MLGWDPNLLASLFLHSLSLWWVIIPAVVPFVVMSVLLLALVFAVPAVATWLPSLVG